MGFWSHTVDLSGILIFSCSFPLFLFLSSLCENGTHNNDAVCIGRHLLSVCIGFYRALSASGLYRARLRSTLTSTLRYIYAPASFRLCRPGSVPAVYPMSGCFLGSL